MEIAGRRIGLYMEGALGEDLGKMGHAILRYAAHEVRSIVDSRHAGKRAGEALLLEREYVDPLGLQVPVVASVEEAVTLGCDTLVLGIAPMGGLIPPEWYPALDAAVASGMTIVNGLHDLLGPRYGDRAWDVRLEPKGLATGTGAASRLAAKRVLMIGTDMAVGKMTAGLEIQREAKRRGLACEFVATGQIGIVITGRGVPLDAVRIDYASGAVEREVLAAAERLSDPDGIIIIEGQGALIHPGSSANLPLLRGACPTHLVLCTKAGAQALRRYPEIEVPPLANYARLYEDLAEACGTFPRPKTVAAAVNSMLVGAGEGRRASELISRETGWPACDPLVDGAGPLLDAILARGA